MSKIKIEAAGRRLLLSALSIQIVAALVIAKISPSYITSSAFTFIALIGINIIVVIFICLTLSSQIAGALESRQSTEQFIREMHGRFPILENAGVSIYVKDLEGKYLVANRSFARLIGIPADALIGKTDFDFFPKDLAKAYLKNDLTVVQEHRPIEVEETVIVDGVTHTFISQKFPMLDMTGHAYALGGISTDITDRKQIEDALRKSNQELEQFAYVASHDLQEPLRMVSSYMGLLEKRYKDKLDKDAQEFIGYAVDGASRMQKLIQDLLSFSRVGTRGAQPVIVNTEESVANALQYLEGRIEEVQAKIEISELPAVLADGDQLTQVFQNLIGNAIKFRGNKPPLITVSASVKNGTATFKVSDNGVGFDQEHAERIFVIFQRLNNRAEYEGTGIGLAICKKIVERHGGSIWAESKAGKGTTFFFTWPQAQDKMPPKPIQEVIQETSKERAERLA